MKPVRANSTSSTKLQPESGTAGPSGSIPKVVFKPKRSSSIKSPSDSRAVRAPSSAEAPKVTKTPTPVNSHRITQAAVPSTGPTLASTAAGDKIERSKSPSIDPIQTPMNVHIENSSDHSFQDTLMHNSVNSIATDSIAPSVFAYLPRSLIHRDMACEAIQVLQDENFLKHRCAELGLYKAAKYHVRDWDSVMQRFTRPTTTLEPEALGNVNVSDEQSIFDAMNIRPEVAMVDDDETILDVKISQNRRSGMVKKKNDEKLLNLDTLMDDRKKSLELFRRFILGLFGKGPIKFLPQDAPTYTYLEAGQALWALGLSHFGIESWDKALTCYNQSLYFLLLEQGYEEHLLLEDMDESDACFYKFLSSKVRPYSEAYRLIGVIFTRIGDNFSSQIEQVEDRAQKADNALHSYKAAYDICSRAVKYYFPQYEDSVESIQVSEPDEPGKKRAILSLAGTFKRIGAVFMIQREYAEAVTSYERALELQTTVLGTKHVDVGKTLHDMGVAKVNRGLWIDAMNNCYAKAYEIFEECYGTDHLDTARTLHNIGRIYKRQKDYDSALSCFRKVLSIRRKLLGDKNESVGIALISIANVLRLQGNLQEAYKYYNRASK